MSLNHFQFPFRSLRFSSCKLQPVLPPRPAFAFEPNSRSPPQTGLFFDHRAGNERHFEANLTEQDLPLAWENRSIFVHVFFARNGALPALHLGGPEIAHGVVLPLFVTAKAGCSVLLRAWHVHDVRGDCL